MTPRQFNELLVKTPFAPFRLHLNSGDVVEITDPGCVYIEGGTLQVFTVHRDLPHVIETNRYIPLRNIAQIERTTPVEPRSS